MGVVVTFIGSIHFVFVSREKKNWVIVEVLFVIILTKVLVFWLTLRNQSQARMFEIKCLLDEVQMMLERSFRIFWLLCVVFFIISLPSMLPQFFYHFFFKAAAALSNKCFVFFFFFFWFRLMHFKLRWVWLFFIIRLLHFSKKIFEIFCKKFSNSSPH